MVSGGAEARVAGTAATYWLDLLLCLWCRPLVALRFMHPDSMPLVSLHLVPWWMVLYSVLRRVRNMSECSRPCPEPSRGEGIVLHGATIHWILWLVMLLCVIPILATGLFLGRRSDQTGPGRWHWRLIGGFGSILGLGHHLYTLRTGPQPSMDDPYLTLLIDNIHGAFLWYWMKRGVRHRAHRASNNGSTVDMAG